jgi:hypothetical protein
VLLLLSLVRLPLYQLFLVTAASLLRFELDRGRRAALAEAGAAAALALLIKIPYGALCGAALVGYLAADAWRSRTAARIAVAGAALVSTYAGAWLLVSHTPAGSLRYLVAGMEFSTGSASAMSVDVENDWRWLGAALLALAAAPACFLGARRGPHPLSVGGLLLPPLFVWLRYGLGREDSAHYAFLLDFLVYAFGLLIVIAPGPRALGALSLLAAGSMLSALHNGRQLGFGGDFGRPQLAGLRDLEAGVLSVRERDRRLKRLAPPMLDSLRLPEALRRRIGDACVDVYPWQTLIVRANDLCWRPRPVFQSYLAYTPYLDLANARHLRGGEGPDYFVWHARNLTSIVDGRYQLNDEPLTLYELLRGYAPVESSGDWLLLARSPRPRLEAPRSLGHSDGRWGEWIEVPASEAAILRAHLAVSRSWRGLLRRNLYKESPTYVEYGFADGSTARHRLVIDNATNGVWVSPHLRTHSADPLLAIDPAQVAPDPGSEVPPHFVDRVIAAGGQLLLSGWAHRAGEDATGQRVFLVLSAGGHAHRVEATRQPRGDVTTHFAGSGLDLDDSGFVANADLSGLSAGDYALDVVVEREGRRAVARWHEPVRIDAAAWAPPTRVTRLRFVDSAGDAFVPELRVEWIGIWGEHPFRE